MIPSLDLAVVIPVYNASASLGQCLQSVRDSECPPSECIVVDDGSTDGSPQIAAECGARVLQLKVRGGPARARNAGVAATSASIILFLDSDVQLHRDTIGLVRDCFLRDSTTDAIFGAYDDTPAAPGLVSQYRNLLHCYTHRRAERAAKTFWAGCGAVRRTVFLESGGFRESYDKPSIEDVELGYRLTSSGARIVLDPEIQVTHLKRWRFWPMVRTDILSRGIPWAELLMSRRNIPDDLNLRMGQRLSTVLVWLMTGAALLAAIMQSGWWLVAVPLLASPVLWLNAGFYRFLFERRGLRFLVGVIPLHFLYHFYNGLSFGIALFHRLTRTPRVHP